MPYALKPNTGRILCRVEPNAPKPPTEGGIILPDTAGTRMLVRALVLETADDVTQFRCGQTVLVHSGDGQPFLDPQGREVRFYLASNVYGAFEEVHIVSPPPPTGSN